MWAEPWAAAAEGAAAARQMYRTGSRDIVWRRRRSDIATTTWTRGVCWRHRPRRRRGGWPCVTSRRPACRPPRPVPLRSTRTGTAMNAAAVRGRGRGRGTPGSARARSRAGTCWWRHWATTSEQSPPLPANDDTWPSNSYHSTTTAVLGLPERGEWRGHRGRWGTIDYWHICTCYPSDATLQQRILQLEYRHDELHLEDTRARLLNGGGRPRPPLEPPLSTTTLLLFLFNRPINN